MINSNETNKIKKLLTKVKEHNQLSFKEQKYLLETAFGLFKDASHYALGLSIICYISELNDKDPLILQLLRDCYVESRIFLYDNMLEKYCVAPDLECPTTNVFNEFAKNFYTLSTRTVLTKDQFNLFRNFSKQKRMVVSAPTSFGKSRIIQELIIKEGFTNSATIIPTLALLNETYQRFKGSLFFSEYKLITSTQQVVDDSKKNILIFTPERMDYYLDLYEDLHLDFFVMDEIYKIESIKMKEL